MLCMLLASTMLCAAGTTVYAAEQPAAQAQAEVTDASGDEADAAVAEEAEILETEEDLDGASSTTAGQGTIDLSSISMSANTANPGMRSPSPVRLPTQQDCIFTIFTIRKTVWRRNSRHIPVPGMQKTEIHPHTIPLPVSGRSK